ncbi:MAG: nidogen-like domain-containing protein [Saprospiraceae bacterium]
MKRTLLLASMLFLAVSISTAQSTSDLKEAMMDKSLQELYNEGFITAKQLLAENPPPAPGIQKAINADCSDAYIPKDDTYIPVPRNDDGSLYIPDMGFTFSFCGTSYSDCYINTNGNISFTQGVAQFSPDGFPYFVPMIAPFWADVDTRNTACEQIFYKLFGNYMIVTWEGVGWFSQNCSPLNTFQLIISDGTAPIIGIGNNIQFRYGDMNWTTGTASGGGPFGGSPATVGYNSGDNINFEQVGRFNLDGTDYDGPFGANDGVDWLDNKCFIFNSGTGSVDLECMNITKALDGNCLATLTPEEVSNVTVNGCAAADVTLDITSFGCNDVGTNIVTITVDDGTGTTTCTAEVTITSGACSVTTLSQVGPFCESESPVFLSASPPGGSWSGNAPGGVFDPASGQGFYTVTYTNPNACPPTASIDIEVFDSPEITINPNPASFCEEDGFVNLFGSPTGGDGNYTITWNTPTGIESGTDIVATTEGQYFVTIIDGNFCENTEEIIVTENLTPFITIVDPGFVCEDQDILTMFATPTGGVWTGDGISPLGDLFPISLGAGTYNYTYTYTDGFGCTGIEFFTLNISEGPEAIAFNTGPYCDGAIIELFGDSSDPTSSYLWSGPNGYTSNQQNPVDATVPGFYLLQVTSASGCVSTEAITEVLTAPGPDAFASNTGPYCANQPIELFASTSLIGTQTTFFWAGPNGYTSTEEVPLDATEPGFYSVVVTVDGCESPEAFTDVIVNPAPDATAFNSGPYCGDELISLFATTGTPGSNVTYQWSGPGAYVSFDQNPTDATEPGIYDVQIIVDGCAADIQSTEVVLNQLTAPSITGDMIFCEGGNTLLDAGVGYTTYQWSNGDQTQTTDITIAGGYTVIVGDDFGCTAEAIVVVDENPIPEPFISGSSSYCAGSFSTLDAGGGFNTYQWSTGDATQDITVSTPGSVSVTVTDANGCTGETTIDVTENSSLSPAIAGEPNFCEGENTLLDAGVFDTYLWTDGETDQNITVTTPGTYAVTVSDVSGCTGEASIVVSENALPAVNILGETAFCENGNTLLETDGTFATYAWSDGTSGENIQVDASGTYSVTVTNAVGCTTENAIAVNVNPLPAPAITGATSFCEGNSTMIDAGGGFTTYLWSDGTETQSLEVIAGGSYTVTVTDANGCTGEEMVDIIENNSLTPVVDGLLSFCEGESTELDAGNGYETYQWNQGSSSQTIIAEETGSYVVTVTDLSGCTGEVTVEVTANNLPQVSIDGITAICDGAATTLTADGAFENYDWSTGDDAQEINVEEAGTYSLLVTDANGCTAEASLNVSLNANPEPVIAGSTTFCEGSSTNLDAGTGFSTYVWSNGSEDQVVEITEGNTLTVTVTDANGCSGEATTVVEESSSLNPVISGDLSFCEGGNSLLNAGSGFETYTWSDGSEEQNLFVEDAGEYDVTVTDNSGCTGEATILIAENNNPTIAISGNEPACEGEVITLDAGDGFTEYQWSDASLNQDLEVTASGTYSVTVTDANGCTAEETVEATIGELPEPSILGSTTFCTGSEVTLQLDDTYDSYEWSDGSDAESIVVNSGGDYTVVVSLASGCTAETMITVTENENLEPTIDGQLSICEGESTVLIAPPGFDYEWSNNTSTQEITVSTTGNYSVLVTDATGCSGTAEVAVVSNDLPEPVIAGSTTFCTGNFATLDAGDVYTEFLWSNGEITQTLQVNTEDVYSVVVTDVNGCTGEALIEVTESTSLNPAISGDLQLCQGESTTLDAGSGFTSYNWSTGDESQSIATSDPGNYSVTVTDASGCTGDGVVEMVVNVNPSVAISGDDTFCENENTVLNAGTGYSEYLWSNGAITQTIDVAGSGSFDVIVTDVNGCTAENSFEVTQNINPIIAIVGPTSFCSGNFVSLSVDGTYDNYQWSTGDNTASVELNAGTDISLIVTDANGCTGEAATTVTENTELIPIVSGDLSFCQGENTSLDVGNNWETYQWSTGDDSPTITVAESGDYEVIITDASGCSGSTVVSVATNQNPEPIIGGSTSFCIGGSTALNVGTYESYVWSTGDEVQNIVTDQAGEYFVTVTNDAGCTGAAVVEVIESLSLNPVISGAPAFCEGEATMLDVGTGFDSYAWSDGSVEPLLEVNAAGDYSVTVTDASGCSGETTIAVNAVSLPSAELDPEIEICNTELSGSELNLYDLVTAGDVNGNWEDADGSGASGLFTNMNFDGVSAGDYSFVYTTNSALAPCPDVSYPVTIKVIDCACGEATLLPVAPICNSDGLLDLSTAIDTDEPGVWTLIDAPLGSNPAGLIGSDFDATGSDAGEYLIQYQFSNAQPLNCPEVFAQQVIVDEEVSAGVADAPFSLCANETGVLTLGEFIIGADPNGTWTETSSSNSQGTAFDPILGTFDTDNQNPLVYTFQYEVAAGAACPAQSTEVTVAINEQPNAVAGDPVELTCADPTNVLDASGSSAGTEFIYQWIGSGIVQNGNENTLTPTVSESGIFELLITNTTTGCTVSDQVEVTESADVPVALAGDDQELTCDVLTTVLQPGQNYDNGFLIEWIGPGITADNANDLNPEVTTAGTYTLVVTDLSNGCTSSPDEVDVVPNTLSPTIITNSPLSNIDCDITAVDLIVSPLGNDHIYEWTDSNGTILGGGSTLAGIEEEGDYTVLVTNTATGCTAMETLEVVDNVSFPSINVSQPDVIDCDNTSAILSGAGSQIGSDVQYSWSGPGLTGPTTEINTEANISGTYTLVITDLSNGCTSDLSIVVEENTIEPIAVASTLDELDCQVEEVNISAIGSASGSNITYQWLDAANTSLGTALEESVTQSGFYSVIVTDEINGCTSIATTTVTENENLPQAALIDLNMPVCHGEQTGVVTITGVEGGTPPYVYSFDGSTYVNDNFYPNLLAGDYELSLEDAAGCEWSTTVSILEPDPINFNLGGDIIALSLGDSTELTASVNIPANQIDTIVWSTGFDYDCITDDCKTINIKPFNQTTLISAEMVDINGCIASAQIRLDLDVERKVFIPSAFSPNGDLNNDIFTIYGEEKQIKNINYFQIYNRWGELVFENADFNPNDEGEGWNGYFRGSMMNPAVFVYMAEIEFVDGHVEFYKGDLTLFR